jgi:hypothetical protein
MPPVSSQVQKLPWLIPTGTQPNAVPDASGHRQEQEVGADAQANGVGWHDRPVDPAVPGVNA